jgi:hypothetical protein
VKFQTFLSGFLSTAGHSTISGRPFGIAVA